MSPPVVALSGANGYVGSLIGGALAGRAEVAPLMRKPRRPGDIAWSFDADPAALANALQARGVTHLVHAAWDMRESSLAELERRCVAGSLALLEAAKRAGVARPVFISTISAFPGARSAYGRAKLETEEAFLAAGGVALRPGLVWGANAGGAFGALKGVVRGARVVPLIGDGRAPQYLLDESTLAATAARATLDGFGEERGPVTLADPTPVSFRDLLQALARAQGDRPLLAPVPWRLLYAALLGAEAIGVRLAARSDSVLSFVYQNPAPDFEPMRRLAIRPRPFAL